MVTTRYPGPPNHESLRPWTTTCLAYGYWMQVRIMGADAPTGHAVRIADGARVDPGRPQPAAQSQEITGAQFRDDGARAAAGITMFENEHGSGVAQSHPAIPRLAGFAPQGEIETQRGHQMRDTDMLEFHGNR
ncbi:hypothetical protein B0293_42700 [Amycolatopsis azurea DSM 43854]|uniref:Uncharacterized protein n=1 Tax=Amycolatopsis azurea DSM 43854 TaxID=1238180 RepID=A0ABX3J0V5_9PSEU|nr:hypothetical protein B0293_42700 [Amycolatopsis azurea DSM 43854]